MPLIISLSGPEDRLGPYKSDIIWTGPLYLLKVYKFYGPNIKHLGAGDRFQQGSCVSKVYRPWSLLEAYTGMRYKMQHQRFVLR